ncbi:LysR family transcriptional regulator [Silvimonas amylolytica]|uniref:LysR family transcriptional regulator n=1 Tax=Silvimonas amylolytica TaxID=449663 RepID=A0ABQ2PH93_9NEIS|nr:LysR family transcriptional regulator [Silvimonas amylolytica]GGP24746.1 LysR family transcriptional regulator [Silvimonas amylolytica]
MKLDGIATFVTVVECKSLSEAALKLRISRSVVSERIVELEKELGTSLLQRTTRKITVTEDGMEFLQHAIRIVREVEEATAVISERRGTLTGPLRISAPVTFGRMHLGPALYPFLAQHPDIQLTLDLNDRRVDPFSDGFDAIIRHGAIQDSRLIAWTLATSQRVLVASPDYLARHGTPSSPEDLEKHRGIFYLNRGGEDWRFVHAGKTTVIRGQPALVINNGDMSRDAAVAGVGIALLPQFIVHDALADGTLVGLDIGIEPEQEFIYIAHREGQRASAKLRALADWLRGAFGNPPYWETARTAVKD